MFDSFPIACFQGEHGHACYQPRYAADVWKMGVGLTFHGRIPFWCGPYPGVAGDSTLFTNFVPWHKMKPWEFGLADSAYSGRPHVVASARKPPNKEFGRTTSTCNNTHAFFRSRMEQLHAIFWTLAIARVPWCGRGWKIGSGA